MTIDTGTNGAPDRPGWWPPGTVAPTETDGRPPIPPPPPPPGPTADITPSDAPPAGRPRSAARPTTADRVAKAKAAGQRHRWIAVAGVVIIGIAVTVNFLNGLADRAGKSVAAPLQAHVQAQTDMVAAITARESAPTQISVDTPLGFLPCPVSNDAAGMIGFEPDTGGAVLDQQRASKVATQVKALIASQPVAGMRLTTPSPTDLVVTTVAAQGVALVDCSPGAAPAQGGDAATRPNK